MSRDGPAVARVCEHHGFLHRPTVVATHETNEAIVAVPAASRMGGVYGLGLDEEAVELGEYASASAIVIAQFEKQVGRLRDDRAVEVIPLSLPHHELEGAFVEASHLARLA